MLFDKNGLEAGKSMFRAKFDVLDFAYTLTLVENVDFCHLLFTFEGSKMRSLICS